MATDSIEVDQLVAGYGQLTILRELFARFRQGDVTLVTGPNGAGKSTLLKTIFGLVKPRSGEIRLEGKVVSRLSPRAILDLGLGFVPQGRNLFPSLSVLHNLELGGITVCSRKVLRDRIEEVLTLFPRLRERIGNQASTLSGGEQKQLEISRALVLKPRILLIDEPSIGLSPKLVQGVFQLLKQLREAGTTIVVVEQNIRSALTIADRAVVVEMGRNVLDRPAGDLLKDPNLNRLILGGSIPHPGAVEQAGATQPGAAP